MCSSKYIPLGYKRLLTIFRFLFFLQFSVAYRECHAIRKRKNNLKLRNSAHNDIMSVSFITTKKQTYTRTHTHTKSRSKPLSERAKTPNITKLS